MGEMELHIWQPVSSLVKGDVLFATLEYGNTPEKNGLRLELTDVKGNKVQVIYDRFSPTVGDCVWTYRYINEIKRSDLNRFIDKVDNSALIDSSAHHFYKVVNSDYIDWYDQLPGLGSNDVQNVEHHIYMYNDGFFEIISDYEPRFIELKK